MCLGVPGQVVEITDADQKRGVVEIAGVRREINLHCIVDHEHAASECLGVWVLVHVGFAMSRIDEAEAAASLALLAELGQMQEELDALRHCEEAGR